MQIQAIEDGDENGVPPQDPPPADDGDATQEESQDCGANSKE